jgi:hypothetical protein
MPKKKSTAKKSTAKKSTAKKSTTKKSTAKRELINTGTDKRYVRRDSKGQFDSSDDVGRSLSKDVQQHAKKVTPTGQGDRGDQKRGGKASAPPRRRVPRTT